MLAIPVQWVLVQWAAPRPGDFVFDRPVAFSAAANHVEWGSNAGRHAMLISATKTGFYALAMRRLGNFTTGAMM